MSVQQLLAEVIAGLKEGDPRDEIIDDLIIIQQLLDDKHRTVS